MIELRVGTLEADPGPPTDRVGLVADVDGSLALVVDGDAIYVEESFPVVELAVALHAWQQSSPDKAREDFEFDSMSAEEPGLIWIRRVAGGWRVGSTDQERAEPTEFPLAGIDAAIHRYHRLLEAKLSDAYGKPVSIIFRDLVSH